MPAETLEKLETNTRLEILTLPLPRSDAAQTFLRPCSRSNPEYKELS